MGESLIHGPNRTFGIPWEKKGPFSYIFDDRPPVSQQYYPPVSQREDSALKYNGAIREMHDNLIADTYRDISPEVLEEVSGSELPKTERKTSAPHERYIFLKEQPEKWSDILQRGVKFQEDIREHCARIPSNTGNTVQTTSKKPRSKCLKPTKREEKSSSNPRNHLIRLGKKLDKDKIICEILNLIEKSHFEKVYENRMPKFETYETKSKQTGKPKLNKSDLYVKEVHDSNNGDEPYKEKSRVNITYESESNTKAFSVDVLESDTTSQEDEQQTVRKGSNRRNHSVDECTNIRDRNNSADEETSTSDSSTTTESTVRQVLPQIPSSAKDLQESLRLLPKMTSQELVASWLHADVTRHPRNVYRICETSKASEIALRDADLQQPTISSKRDIVALTKSERIGELERIYGDTSCFNLYFLPQNNIHQPEKELEKSSPISNLT